MRWIGEREPACARGRLGSLRERQMERGRVAGQSRGWQLAAAPPHRTAPLPRRAASTARTASTAPHRSRAAPHPRRSLRHAREPTGGWRQPPLPPKAKKKKGFPFSPTASSSLRCFLRRPWTLPSRSAKGVRTAWKAHSLFLFTVMPAYAGIASFSTGLNDCRNLVAVQKVVFWSQIIRRS